MKTAMTIVALGLVFGLTAGCADENPDAGNSQPAPPSVEQLPDMSQPVDQAVLSVGGPNYDSGAGTTQLDFEKHPITLETCRQLGNDASKATWRSSISCLHQGVRVAGFTGSGELISPAPSR